jgi:Flp pilus assembly protein TadB
VVSAPPHHIFNRACIVDEWTPRNPYLRKSVLRLIVAIILRFWVLLLLLVVVVVVAVAVVVVVAVVVPSGRKRPLVNLPDFLSKMLLGLATTY